MDFTNVLNANYIQMASASIIRPKFKIEILDQNENAIMEITQNISKDSSGSISINYQQGVRRSCSITLIDAITKIYTPENINLMWNYASDDNTISYGDGATETLIAGHKITPTLINSEGTLIPKSENGLFWIGRKFKLYIGLEGRVNTGLATSFLRGSHLEDTISVSIADDYEIYLDSDILLESSVILGYVPVGDIDLMVSQDIVFETDTYWFSQGIFYLTNPSAMRNLSNHTVTINGVDKFGLLGAELGYNQIATSYSVLAGATIYNVIREILSLDIGNGYVVDPIPPVLDPLYKDVILPYDINKASGSYFGEIIIELAKILGSDVFYDVDGRLNLISAVSDISYSQKASIWEYTDVLPEYSGAGISFDFVGAINVVKVVSDNVSGAVIEYTAENNNPSSSTRIELIGKKIYPIQNSAYVFDQNGAKDYAEYLLNIKSIVQAKLDFSSSLLPHLDVANVVGITDSYFDYVQQRFIIQSLTIPLSTSSLMSISASNVAELPFFSD